jgi:glycosyltransferase involved in cell wall biosynthesis
MIEAPYLFDVTRLVSRSWTRRQSTGLDRVSYAYMERFGPRAHAVVQNKGVSRILSHADSLRFFDMLSEPDKKFREQMIRFACGALMNGKAHGPCDDAIYLNVSHTEFDLRSHTDWINQCRLRPVYLIHDLIPILHPEFCRPHAVRRHRGRVRNALKTASGIILNSEATAHDLTRFAAAENLPQPAIRAIPIAGANLSATADPVATAEPYFVCVGTIEPRKNHRFLLSLWQELSARLGKAVPRLIVIGQWGHGSAEVRQMLKGSPQLQSCVTVLSHCPDTEMAGWMNGAAALLMPTLAEGFGLPLVEALQMGTPVIASDLPIFREMGQGIPSLINPDDRAAWIRSVERFAANGPDRFEQITALLSYRAPSWDEHFQDLEQWLESLPPRATRNSPLADRPDNVALAQALRFPKKQAKEPEASSSVLPRPLLLSDIEFDHA